MADVRPIDEVAAREKFHNNLAYMGTDVKMILAAQPTINPDDLRPQGRWEEGYLIHKYGCSCCWARQDVISPYCPNCGAKMDATDNNVGGKIDSSDELPSWQQSVLRTFGGDADV